MESLPITRPADTQILQSPIDLTSSSGPPSAASTRETSPASSIHHIASTISSSVPKKLSSACSDRRQRNMDPFKDQSLADEKAPEDGRGRMIDTQAPVQDPDGSANLCPAGTTTNSNHSVSHATSHWQNLGTQHMIAIGDSGNSGLQSHNTMDYQDAGVAQTFARGLDLGRRERIPAEGSFGNPRDPHNGLGHQDAAGSLHNIVSHQKGLDDGALDNSGVNIPVLLGHGARGIQSTPESTFAAPSLHKFHQEGLVPQGESCLGLRGHQSTLAGRTLGNAPPDNGNADGQSQGNNPSPPNAHSTGGGHLGLWAAWNPYNTIGNIPAAQDFFIAPQNTDNAEGENHLPLRGLLAAPSCHKSDGDVLGTRSFHNDHKNNLPSRGLYYDPSSTGNTRAVSRSFQKGQKNILPAECHHNALLNASDTEEPTYSSPQGSLLAQDQHNDRKNTLVAGGLHNEPPIACNARGRGGLAPRNLCDARRNILVPRNFSHNVPSSLYNEPSDLCIKTGSSDHVARGLPIFQNTSTTPESTVPANTASVHHRHHQHHHHHHCNNISNFAASISGFSSPVESVFFSNAPSVSTTPYVTITSPSTTHLSRNDANNNAAPPQRLEPLADTSRSVSTAPSSSNTHTAAMFPPNGIVISDADMERAMSYCYDRGNGQYTRLVPVDVLPFSLRDLPARVSSDEGMIVLPVPRMIGPDGQPANVQLIAHVARNNVTVSPATIVFPSGICTFWLEGLCEGIIQSLSSDGFRQH